MASLEWFYIQSWQQKEAKRLFKHRKITVDWETDGKNVDLPTTVVLPENIFEGLEKFREINQRVSNYLSEEYGWLVYDWNVYKGDK